MSFYSLTIPLISDRLSIYQGIILRSRMFPYGEAVVFQ